MSLDYAATVAIDTTAGLLQLAASAPSLVDPFLADGLALRWAREGNAQPEPVEARFRIVAPGVLPVDVGRRVSVLVHDAPGGDPVATFYGRVAEVQAEPVEYGDGTTTVLGLAHDVVCVDYTADLAELTANFPAYVGAATPAIRTAFNRIRAYINDGGAGIPGTLGGVFGSAFGGGGMDTWTELLDEDAAAGNTLDRVLGVLAQVGTGELPADVPGETFATALDRRLHRRCVLAPRVDADTPPGDFHAAGDWGVDAPPATYTSADPLAFPAVLTDGPLGWGLVIDEDSPVALPAAQVELGVKWRRDKFTHPNRATVTYTPPGATDATSVSVDADDKASTDPVVTIGLDAPLLGAVKAGYAQTADYGPRRMALMYLPEADARDRWQADSFRYYPEDWTRLLHQPWFPLHEDVDDTPETTPSDPATRAACYAVPLVVSGIDPAFHPMGREWYAGTLSAVTLTLGDARAVLDVQLRRVLPVPTGAGALTPADLDPAITVADLDPRFTVYDYRLARGA